MAITDKRLGYDPSLTYHGERESVYFARIFEHPLDGFEILLVVTHNQTLDPWDQAESYGHKL